MTLLDDGDAGKRPTLRNLQRPHRGRIIRTLSTHLVKLFRLRASTTAGNRPQNIHPTILPSSTERNRP